MERMAASSEIREKLRKKRRALQDTLVKNKNEDDIQALVPSARFNVDQQPTAMKEAEGSDEDPGETLRRTLRAQRQRRKKKLLEQSFVQESHDAEDAEEVPPARRYSANEGSADRADDSVVSTRPPTGSQKALSVRSEDSSSSQNLDTYVTRHLQEKLRAARSKGESLQQQEASEVSVEPVSRLQRLKNRDTVTRFDREAEPISAGRQDDPLALRSRVKFREAGRRVVKDLPTAEEAFNFFTFNYEPEPPSQQESDSHEIRLMRKCHIYFSIQNWGISQKRQKQRERVEKDKSEDSQEEAEVEEDAEAEEDNQDQNENQSEDAPLVQNEDDLFVIDRSPQDFVGMRKAEYVAYRKRVQRDRELLFTPSFRTVPTSVKLPENMKPRFLEDEGLYVGERPPVSLTNENILENRILKMAEGNKWFGDDGKVIALPDPIKESSTRPPLFHMEGDLDPALQTVYRKALQSKYANLYITGAADPEGDYQLDMDVSGLIFSHHPLFSREHVLASRLAQLYDQYLSRQHNNLTGHLTDKLNGLRNALQNMMKIHGEQGSSEALQQRISEYSLEVRNTRQLRDTEQEKDRTLLKSVIKVWKEIKALREFQKFTNTPFKLYLRRLRRNNLRIFQIPEGSEEGNVAEFVKDLLPKVLTLPPDLDIRIERAHRSLLSKPLNPAAPPRSIIERFLDAAVKDVVIQQAWRQGQVSFQGKRIFFDQDYSPELQKRRVKVHAVVKQLKQKGVQAKCMYPARLKIKMDSGDSTFASLMEASDTLERLGVQVSHGERERLEESLADGWNTSSKRKKGGTLTVPDLKAMMEQERA
ncbi:coiled-coil and C2 domain-containing protein 2A-like [Fundulus diaphanus]